MSRLRRVAFNLVCALSCIGVCVLWVRSYRVIDTSAWYTGDSYIGVIANRGVLAFISIELIKTGDFSLQHGWVQSIERPSAGTVAAPVWQYAGFHVQRVDIDDAATRVPLVRGWYGHIPFWFLALTLAIPPILWLRKRRRRRIRPGLCPACGYDLRASPRRCPECGAAATAPPLPLAGRPII